MSENRTPDDRPAVGDRLPEGDGERLLREDRDRWRTIAEARTADLRDARQARRNDTPDPGDLTAVPAVGDRLPEVRFPDGLDLGRRLEQANRAVMMVYRWVNLYAQPAGDRKVLIDQLVYVQDTLTALAAPPAPVVPDAPSRTAPGLELPADAPTLVVPDSPDLHRVIREAADDYFESVPAPDDTRDVVDHIHAAVLAVAHPTASAPQAPGVMRGAALIAAERQRQIDVEGYTPEHDNAEHATDLAAAGAAYALTPAWRGTAWGVPGMWPWGREFWKPTPNDRVRELVKAGALIAAAIDASLPVVDAPAAPEEGPVMRTTPYASTTRPWWADASKERRA